MVLSAPMPSASDVYDALASVADNQEVDASLCKLAAPALAVPQEDLFELDVSLVCCQLGNSVQDLGQENMVWLHHCSQSLFLGLCLTEISSLGQVLCSKLMACLTFRWMPEALCGQDQWATSAGLVQQCTQSKAS